jgi:hypothetical protein
MMRIWYQEEECSCLILWFCLTILKFSNIGITDGGIVMHSVVNGLLWYDTKFQATSLGFEGEV